MNRIRAALRKALRDIVFAAIVACVIVAAAFGLLEYVGGQTDVLAYVLGGAAFLFTARFLHHLCWGMFRGGRASPKAPEQPAQPEQPIRKPPPNQDTAGRKPPPEPLIVEVRMQAAPGPDEGKPAVVAQSEQPPETETEREQRIAFERAAIEEAQREIDEGKGLTGEAANDVLREFREGRKVSA